MRLVQLAAQLATFLADLRVRFWAGVNQTSPTVHHLDKLAGAKASQENTQYALTRLDSEAA